MSYKNYFIRNSPHAKKGYVLKEKFISPVVPQDHGLDPAFKGTQQTELQELTV